jgi:hypothetical protein
MKEIWDVGGHGTILGVWFAIPHLTFSSTMDDVSSFSSGWSLGLGVGACLFWDRSISNYLVGHI